MNETRNTIQCCDCKRTREGRSWTPKPTFPSDSVSHTYCPNCLRKAMGQVAKNESTRNVGQMP
ncbi:MAG: hypothetical protein ACI9X0_001391 [Kiritimatiellia bacterium]|jgi:hypothetical protein